MRKMRATTAPIHEYNSPAEAIRAGKEANVRLRTVADDQVRGQIIRRMIWDDTALTLEFEGRKYLNIAARSAEVRCSLDDRPAVTHPGPDEDVIVEFSRHAFEWHRAELAQKFIGHPVTRLWFSEEGIYVYVPHSILACSLMVAREDGQLWLLWEESD